jgi:acyl-CoA hydrolase
LGINQDQINGGEREGAAMMKDKIKTAEEAIALIRNGDVVSCSGFVGTGTPEELIAAFLRPRAAMARSAD